MRSPSLLFVLPHVRAYVPHATGRALANRLISALHRSPRQCPSTPACDHRVECPLLRWMFAHEDARLRPRFYISPPVPSRNLLTFASSASFLFSALIFKAMFPSAGAPLEEPGYWLPIWGLMASLSPMGPESCAAPWEHGRTHEKLFVIETILGMKARESSLVWESSVRCLER